MKSHKGIQKRFKKSHPKRGKAKLTRQSKGRGSKHLKTKQSNPRKRRIRQRVSSQASDKVRKITPFLN